LGVAKHGPNEEDRQVLLRSLAGEIAVFEGDYTSATSGKTLPLRMSYNPTEPGKATLMTAGLTGWAAWSSPVLLQRVSNR